MMLSKLQEALISLIPVKTYTIKVVNEHGKHTDTLVIEATNYCSILGYLTDAYPHSKFTILNIESCELCNA